MQPFVTTLNVKILGVITKKKQAHRQIQRIYLLLIIIRIIKGILKLKFHFRLNFFFNIRKANYKFVEIRFRQRQRRPDRAVYVPRGRRSQTTPPTAQTSNSGAAPKTEVFDNESVNVISSSNLAVSPSQSSGAFELKHPNLEIDTQELIVHEEVVVEPSRNPPSPIAIQAEKPQLQNINTISNMADANININCEGNKIDGALSTSDKDYNEEKEFQKASKVNITLMVENSSGLFLFLFQHLFFFFFFSN